MNQYLLINRVKVQGANAVAGFTWGFPAITHFLGFTHNLSRKLNENKHFSDIVLSGCAVIVHHHQVHTYGFNEFTQSRNPAYQYKEEAKNKVGTPPIIEEGKMNMEVSLLIACEGNIGNREEELIQWLNNTCQLQRLAGGSILSIKDIAFYTIDDEQNPGYLRKLVRKLLPGFVLQDRSAYLEKHFRVLQEKDTNFELFDAWMDFIALKQKARPVYKLIQNHLTTESELKPDDEQTQERLKFWQEHLDQPYEQDEIPEGLKHYFSSLDEKSHKNLLAQWQAYIQPNEKTDAVWEYIKKPEPGFLVPIMTGYKAISLVYKNEEVANTRDNETDVCFVEAVHSIGEWQGVHHLKNANDLKKSLWRYHYEPNWYLCQQGRDSSQKSPSGQAEIRHENPDDDFS